jgi:four helix bundle protein
MIRFEFKRLVVYQVALRYFGWAVRVAARMPRPLKYLADQFVRASLSIMLNIAEAAGLWSPGNKRKHYEYARGSTFESAALLDALRASGVITEDEFETKEEELAEIGARLTRLCQRYDRAAPRRGPDHTTRTDAK